MFIVHSVLSIGLVFLCLVSSTHAKNGYAFTTAGDDMLQLEWVHHQEGDPLDAEPVRDPVLSVHSGTVVFDHFHSASMRVTNPDSLKDIEHAVTTTDEDMLLFEKLHRAIGNPPEADYVSTPLLKLTNATSVLCGDFKLEKMDSDSVQMYFRTTDTNWQIGNSINNFIISKVGTGRAELKMTDTLLELTTELRMTHPELPAEQWLVKIDETAIDPGVSGPSFNIGMAGKSATLRISNDSLIAACNHIDVGTSNLEETYVRLEGAGASWKIANVQSDDFVITKEYTGVAEFTIDGTTGGITAQGGLTSNTGGLDVAGDIVSGSGSVRLGDTGQSASIVSMETTGGKWEVKNDAGVFKVTKSLSGVAELQIASGGAMTVAGDVTASGVLLTSNVHLKHKVEPIDHQETLRKMKQMNVDSWVFKEDPDQYRHYGVMAQDFAKAFPLRQDDETLSVTDSIGVAYSSIKALTELVEAQAVQIQALEARLDAAGL